MKKLSLLSLSVFALSLNAEESVSGTVAAVTSAVTETLQSATEKATTTAQEVAAAAVDALKEASPAAEKIAAASADAAQAAGEAVAGAAANAAVATAEVIKGAAAQASNVPSAPVVVTPATQTLLQKLISSVQGGYNSAVAAIPSKADVTTLVSNHPYAAALVVGVVAAVAGYKLHAHVTASKKKNKFVA